MYKRVNWLLMWLLGFVTLFIYRIIQRARMTNQQNEMAERLGEKKLMNYIGVFLLGIITCGIVPLIWSMQFCRQQKILAEAKGVDLFPIHGWFGRWLLMFVPGFKFYVLCTNHNRLCDAFEDS